MGITKDIEALRDELNRVVSDSKRKERKDIIAISRKLDNLIHKYYEEEENGKAVSITSR